MFIASQLKNQNIIEYLLYMWQIEDLIRAFELNIDKINAAIIEPYPVGNEEKQSLYHWYESLIEMMRDENAQQNGHLQLNKNVIIQLNDFHSELLQSGQEPGYNGSFFAILPSLNALRMKQNEMEISDIELAFNFLYGIMLLKIKKTEISLETQRTQTVITRYLTLLNKHYRRFLDGELQFD